MILTRFEQTILRRNADGDALGVFANALVWISGRGATTTAAAPIPASDEADIDVASLGDIIEGSDILAGLDGVSLHVEEAPKSDWPVTGPTRIRVSRTPGTPFTIPLGTRLILTSARPKVYADPFGARELTLPLEADHSGRVVGYVARRWFDVVVEGTSDTAEVTYKAASHVPNDSYSTNAVIQVSWPLTIPESNNRYRCLLVGVAWSSISGSHPAQPRFVTFAGRRMDTLVQGASPGFASPWLYIQYAPPTGPHDVDVVFGPVPPGTIFDDVNVVAGAIQFANVDGLVAHGVAQNNHDSTNIVKSVDGIDKVARSALVDLYGVLGSNSGTPHTPDRDETWDKTAGTSDLVSSGSSRAATDSGHPEPTWTLASSAAWEYRLVNVRPIAAMLPQLFVDVQGTTQAAPDWINASDFPDLAKAIAALPATGGEVYLPAGVYPVVPPLVIDKPNVTLRGDGCWDDPQGLSVIRPESVLTADLVRIVADGFAMHDVKLDGVAAGAAPHACLQITGADAETTIKGVYLENVELHGVSGDGLVIHDVEELTAVNLRSGSSVGNGVSIGETLGTRGLYFLGGGFSGSAAGKGVVIRDCRSIALQGCTMEGNKGGTGSSEGAGVDADGTDDINILACYFEQPPDSLHQYIFLKNCSSAQVANCYFNAFDSDPPPESAIRLSATSGAVVTGNVANGMGSYLLAVTDGTTPPTTGVVEHSNTALSESSETTPAPGLFSLSHGYVGLFRSPEGYMPGPSGLDGSILWADGASAPDRLAISDGSRWMKAAATIASVDLPNRTSSTSDNLTVDPPGAGFYRVTWYARVVTTGTSGAMALTILWDDGNDDRTIQVGTLSLTSITEISGTIGLHLADGAYILYQAQKTGSGGEYSLYLRAEVV